jgi:hypothetical protein
MSDLRDAINRIEERDAVYFDAVNGVAGTEYPIGTIESPVNNCADLATILGARMTNKVFLLSDITFDRAFTEIEFIGKGASDEIETVSHRVVATLNNRNLSGCVVQNCITDGTWATGTVTFKDCIIYNWPWDTGNGYFYRCRFPDGDGMQLAAGTTNPKYHFEDCHFEANYTIYCNDLAGIVMKRCIAQAKLTVSSLGATSYINLYGGYFYVTATTEKTIYLSGDCQAVVTSLIALRDARSVEAVSPVKPTPKFIEDWLLGVIDPVIWTPTDPATGAAWSIQTTHGVYSPTGSPFVEVSPNANEEARLVSVLQIPVPISSSQPRSMWHTMVMEWEMYITGVANLDNTRCFFGLTKTAADVYGSADILGFALSSDKLVGHTNHGASSYTTAEFSITNGWSRCRIVVAPNDMAILSYGGSSQGRSNAADVAHGPLYMNFYVDTEATGAATVRIGAIRWWLDDVYA